jgi:ribokinase
LIPHLKSRNLQQEVPHDSLAKAVEIANQANVPVMLNPAPVREVDSKFLSKISIIVPNETEATFLTGIDVSSLSKAVEASKALFQKGSKVAVVTLGHRGAVIKTTESCFHVEGYTVDFVDTTAAGDAFCAALAFMYSQKAKIEECIRFANAVGAMATMVRGAEPAPPQKSAVDQFINSRSPLKVQYFD